MSQTDLLLAVVALVVGIGVGAGVFALIVRRVLLSQRVITDEAQNRLARIEDELSSRQKELQIEARESAQREVERLRAALEQETAARKVEFKDDEARLRERESGLRERETALREREAEFERRLRGFESREKSLQSRQDALEQRLKDADGLVEKQELELERVARLSNDEARELLLARVETEARDALNGLVERVEDETRKKAEERARRIIALAVQRCAVDQTSESAVSVVPLPSEDLKGRIIGREGRNIRTFEQLSGTDLIIDDTPEAVVVSCFDPVRREVARTALAQLVNDGRIHPARIEEVLARAESEIETKMREASERACAEVGLRLPRPMAEVFGRLLYRTSYGQNMLKHSIEVAKLASTIAAEIGADVNVCKRAGFLHDIGKALDQDHEGTHVDLGVELMKRHRENDAVIRAAGEHHMDVEKMSSLESVVVQVADAISSSRPGARRENVEIYVKRLEALEKLANSFEGVEKAFAVQAGREVRVVVQPNKVDDVAAMRLARDIAHQVQDELTYPGEVRITVIRETRASEIAH